MVIGLSCLCLFKVLPEIVVFWMFSVQLSFLELLGVIFFLLLVPRGKCKSDFKIYVPICHLWHSLSYIHIFAVAQFGLGGPNFARTSRGPRAISRGARAGPSNSPVCYFINQLVGCVRFVTYIIFCCP